MSALSTFAVLAFVLSNLGAASAATNPGPANQYPSGAPGGRQPVCINDPRGSASLRGYLHIDPQSAQHGSIVRLFADSGLADSYVNEIEQQLSGRPPTAVTARAQNSDAMTTSLTRMQAVAALIQSSKSVIVGTDGKFDCSGFLPGRYILLAAVVGMQGTTQRPGLTQSYWRADVNIPSPNRPRTYVVSTFRLLGAAPL
jgi:hypothetical protein